MFADMREEARLENEKELLRVAIKACRKIASFDLPHHLFCNYPSEVNDFCNCGVTDVKRFLERVDKEMKYLNKEE